MKTLIVLVGPAGAGKSTYAKENYSEYVYINQDSHGKIGHLQLFCNAIEAESNIIVDRMNFNKEQRKRYLEPAKDAGYTTEIIVLHESYDTCITRCEARVGHPTIKCRQDASKALNTFFKLYERPKDMEADTITFMHPADVVDECIVIDLDGTLCNLNHREHFVKGEKKDWKGFFEGISGDTPNTWCDFLVKSMQWSRAHIVFASGRPDDHRIQTQEWLSKYGYGYKYLFMRPRGDYRQDYIVKETILDFEILTRFKPLFFVDDRKQAIDMYRQRGFTVLDCAGEKGDF
jgi:hypothetical protein